MKRNGKEEKSYDRSGYDPMKSNVKDILTQEIERPSRATTFSDDNYSDEEEPDRPGTESAVPTPPTPETKEDDAHPTILAKGHIAVPNREATGTVADLA